MTREEYLNTPSLEAHRTYYGQFVSPRTIAVVVSVIGAERLLGSTDPHFNDIPLKVWDALAPIPLAVSFLSLGDFPTPAGSVCVAKEAARQFVERSQKS